MLGRRIVYGRSVVGADQLLGLELGLLVGVVERLADVEVALGEAPAWSPATYAVEMWA